MQCDVIAESLNIDPHPPVQRPSAVEALEHPWLRRGGPSERGTGKPLGGQVVQRLQRFGHSSLFKRTVLQVGPTGALAGAKKTFGNLGAGVGFLRAGLVGVLGGSTK